MIFILLHVVQNQWSSQSRSVRSDHTAKQHSTFELYWKLIGRIFSSGRHIVRSGSVQSFTVSVLWATYTVRHRACPADQWAGYTVQCCAVQRGIKRVHLTSSSSWCRAQPCSHGNCEQVQDTQLFQSLIMPILFSQLIIIILVISTTILSFNIYNISSAQVVMKVILTILTKFSLPSAASPLNVGFSREHQTGVSLQTSR